MINEEIIEELKRATSKYPSWPSDPLHAVSILGEEYGELVRSLLQMVYEPHKTSMEEVRMEAIQTAAMAIRFAMSLNNYDYKISKQHLQQWDKLFNSQEL